MIFQVVFVPAPPGGPEVLATVAAADAATLAFHTARDALRASGAHGELLLLGQGQDRRVVLHEILAPMAGNNEDEVHTAQS